MAKRKNNEGSYGTKTINGVEYRYYRFPDGHYVYGKKSKDVEEKKKAYQEKLDKNQIVNDNFTVFEDYCKIWLKQRWMHISERVYDDYESIIDARIAKSDIGKMQIKGLTENAFSIFFKEMAEKYSKASINKTYVVVKQVLKYGIKNKDIPELDFDDIAVPKETDVAVKKKAVPFITKEDMDLLIKEIEDNPNKYGDGTKVIIFIMHSGLRISEAIGLKWKYVSNDFASVKIEQSDTKVIKRDKYLNPIKEGGKNAYKRVTKGTKSEEGQRTVPISSKGQEILRYFDHFEHSDDDYVFISKIGKPFTQRTVSRTLEACLKNSNCSRKDYTLHCLRHGFGSVLIQKGVDIKLVSEMLGHSDVAFTYNTYIGTQQKDKENAIKSVFD